MPGYLKSEKENEYIIIAKARCGTLEGVNRVWAGEKEKYCWLCGKGQDSIEHWKEECEEVREINLNVAEILSGEGGKEAAKWLKEIGKRKDVAKKKAKEKEMEERAANDEERGGEIV